MRLFHVIMLYLSAICFLLNELFLSVNECMYAILQFTVTKKVKCELNVSSILYMILSVLDSRQLTVAVLSDFCVFSSAS